jgi:hypothetical protein
MRIRQRKDTKGLDTREERKEQIRILATLGFLLSTRLFRSFLFWVSVLGFFFGQAAYAQSAYSRFEIGAQASLLDATLPGIDPTNGASGGPFVIGGFGGRFTWNLSRSFALDSQFDWFPKNQTTTLQSGGDAIEVLAGPKIALYRGQHFGFFAKVRPGILSSDHVCVEKAVPPSAFACSYGRVTHFAVDMGGAVELYPTRRLIVRIDVGETLIQMHDREATLALSRNFDLIAISPGGIRPALQIEAGFSYRPGGLSERQERDSYFKRFEIGAGFAALGHGYNNRTDSAAGQVTTAAGFGGHFDFDICPYLAFDSALIYFPKSEPVVTAQSGGKVLEGLFGAKIGLRRDRVGYFLTLRPGFLRYSRTVTEFPASPTGVFGLAPNTIGALNVGTAIEVYTSRRTMLRFDVGDTMLFVPAKTVPQPPLSPISFNPDLRHTIQISTGFGFRF